MLKLNFVDTGYLTCSTVTIYYDMIMVCGYVCTPIINGLTIN